MSPPEQPTPPALPDTAPTATLPVDAATQSQKGPFVRPGQRKPYIKGTRRQIELRIEAADLLRCLGLTKTEIHRIFQKRYGVEWRQTDRYMARVREENARRPMINPPISPVA